MTLETGSTDAVGETCSVSTSASRFTASRTTDSWPVKRSTSSEVSAIRASDAAFSTTERSIAMDRSLGCQQACDEPRTEQEESDDDRPQRARQDRGGGHVFRGLRQRMRL